MDEPRLTACIWSIHLDIISIGSNASRMTYGSEILQDHLNEGNSGFEGGELLIANTHTSSAVSKTEGNTVNLSSLSVE